MAVLTGKVHRMVFEVGGGDYWLEVADRNDVFLSVEGLDRDLNKEEEEEARLAFEESFKNYEDMLDNPLFDPDEEKEVIPLTPLTAGKERLQRTQVDDGEEPRMAKTHAVANAVSASHASRTSRAQTKHRRRRRHGAGFLVFFPRWVCRSGSHSNCRDAGRDDRRSQRAALYRAH